MPGQTDVAGVPPTGGMPPGIGAGAGVFGSGASDQRRLPSEKYAEQFMQIKEMGFNDEDAIL